MNFLKLIIFCIFVIHNPHLAAQTKGESLVGTWIAIDSINNGNISTIELFMNGQFLNGRITKITDRDGNPLNPICEKCSGNLSKTPTIGVTFITQLRQDGNRWVDGKVVDLRPGLLQGVIASCEIEMIGARARIYGYLGLRLLGGESFWDRAATQMKPAQ